MNASVKPRTQEQRKAESERRIIRAAIEIFAKQGYLRTTLNEVGQAAGYTGGLVTHRFGSKEGLLKAVVANATGRFLEDQMRPAIEAPGVSSAEDVLRRYIETYLNEVFVRESHIRALYVIMGESLGAVPDIQADIARLNRDIRSYLEGIVQQGIDTGEFSAQVAPKAAAVLILGLLRGTVMQYLSDNKAFKKADMLPILQNSAVAGLKSV